MEIRENTPLLPFNTFRVNAFARYFAEISSEAELIELISDKRFINLPKLPLGEGSNVLFTGDFNGLVMKISISGITLKHLDDTHTIVEVKAGEPWHGFVEYCLGHDLGGVENLSLIPGLAGAAPIQNIGAYGVEIKDVLLGVTALDLGNGQHISLNNEECRFGYRDSIFKNELKGRTVVTSVRLKLSRDSKIKTAYGVIERELETMGVTNPGIKEVSEAICRIRNAKLPNPAIVGNAGSFFKNPVIPNRQFEELRENYPDLVGYPEDDSHTKVAAGWLIDKAGWKGKRHKNCGVHHRQALVLVNHGGASGEEILQLSEDIGKDIYSKFGIMLQREVNLV